MSPSHEQERFCPTCGVEVPLLVAQLEVIQGLERELRAKRSQIKRLQREQFGAVAARPEASSAHSVLEYWQQKLAPGAKELGGDRLKVVVDRLRGGYTEQELRTCIDGYAAAPFVVNGRRQAQGGPQHRQVEATLIFRTPGHVDRGISYAAAEQNSQEVLMPKDGDEINPETLTAYEVLSDLGQQAVRFVRHQWNIFPVRKLSKEPATRNGVLDATLEEERITQWWWRHPDDNIGLACGAASNVVVLDVDGDVGALSLRQLESQHTAIPVTASVDTPSGGRHFYFKHPGTEIRNSVSMLGMGIDIRGDGGYVVAPPSVLVHGSYSVDESHGLASMPTWLVEAIQSHQERRGPIGRSEAWAQVLRQDIGTGTRNQQLTRIAGFILNLVHDPEITLEFVLMTNQVRVKPPLDTREVEKIVASINRIQGRRE
jgi:hypothetical protein